MKRFLAAISLTILILATAVPAVYAAAASKAAADSRHPQLKKFEDGGGKVEFLGKAFGLDGWMLTKEGEGPRTVYTTPEGGLVMGMLVNPQGIVETSAQLAALKARQDGSQAAMPDAEKSDNKAERLYAEIEKTRWIRMGNETAPYIYVLMNVDCPHCQKYWQDLSKIIKTNTLQVRLVPFGTARINREGGAALLSVNKPDEAWNQYIDGKPEALSADKAMTGMIEAIDKNTGFVRKWGFQGAPPYTVYRKRTDGQVTAILGKPENMMLVQADLIH